MKDFDGFRTHWTDASESHRRHITMLLADCQAGSDELDRKRAVIKKTVGGLLGLVRELNPAQQSFIIKDEVGGDWKVTVVGSIIEASYWRDRCLYRFGVPEHMQLEAVERVHAALPALLSGLLVGFPLLGEKLIPFQTAAHNARRVRPNPLGPLKRPEDLDRPHPSDPDGM